jgi:hypothetical protein
LRQSTSVSIETPQALTPTSAPETARPKTILPIPPKFDGTRSEYKGWKSLIKDKINIDEKAINSAKNQFIYITSRLKGKELQLTFTFIIINKNVFDAFATRLLNYLDSIFDNRYKTQHAVETLRTIKQNFKKFFSAFFLRFKKALADAEGMIWPDEIKRSHFNSVLIFELRRLTITMPFIATYGAYVDEILRMSDLYRSVIRYAFKEQSITYWEASDAINWEFIRAAAAALS